MRVKIYSLDSERGELVRAQALERVSVKAANGYRCMKPADFDLLMEKAVTK